MLDIEKLKSSQRLPKHVAVIMDGNGRWAKKQGFKRIFGHNKGVETTRNLIEMSVDLGLEHLTLYTFSKENWKRPRFEVEALMTLLVKTLQKELTNMKSKCIKLQLLGSYEGLPKITANSMMEAVNETKNNTGMCLNLALNYSGRAEIVEAVNKMIQLSKNTSITEESFSDYLYIPQMPDPELVIRTGGEFRISNFLLWQMAYSEIYVTDVLWPDFDTSDYLKAINFFINRERRFGKITEQLK